MNFKCRIVWFATFSMLVHSFGWSATMAAVESNDVEESLFNRQDNSIIQINASTFDQEILNQPTLSVLIVYSLHCGSCHNYAPVYTSLAHHVYGWRQFVRLYVMRCDQNIRFCANLGFRRTPSTKIYPPHSKSRSSGLSRPNHNDLRQFENMLLEDLKSISMPSLPADTLDAISPLPTDHLSDESSLIKLIQKKAKAATVLVMLEEAPCLTGQKLVLDFWPYRDYVQFMILAENGQKWFDLLVQDQSIFLPILFQANGNALKYLER